MVLNEFNNTIGKVIAKKLEEDCTLREFLLFNNRKEIGKCVLEAGKIVRKHEIAATSICRRKFNVEDIILLVIQDDEEEGEAGIAFTENGIYQWQEKEELVAEVMYDNIKSVDYDEESVIITTKDGKNVDLYCDDDCDEKYSRYMYNFIADIVEFLEKEK